MSVDQKGMYLYYWIKVYANGFSNFQIPEGTNRESYRQAIEANLKFEVE